MRTVLQHIWAEFSEKLSDKIDPAIKYGGGDAELSKKLVGLSDHVGFYEKQEYSMPGLFRKIKKDEKFLKKQLSKGSSVPEKEEFDQAIKDLKETAKKLRRKLKEYKETIIEEMEFIIKKTERI